MRDKTRARTLHRGGGTLKHTSALLSLIHPGLSVTSSVDIPAHISFTQAWRASACQEHLIPSPVRVKEEKARQANPNLT